MFEGLYNAASGMISQSKIQEVIAANISKANIPGYKKQSAVSTTFQSELSEKINSNDANLQTNEGVEVEGIYTIFDQGRLIKTENPLDLAIEGDGFFTVEAEGQKYYTRCGAFTINSEGNLITQSGYPVMGEKGYINLLDKDTKTSMGINKIIVTNDGAVMIQQSDSGKSKKVDDIIISKFDDLQKVKPIGDGLFKVEGQEAKKADKFVIQQGYLEESNVNIIEEMVNMITNLRVYEANQKSFKNIGDTFSKGISELSRT